MLVFIKALHSVVFIGVSTAILYVWYAIFTGAAGGVLLLAVGVILLETSIYLGSGSKCPLTSLAQRYGDSSGGNDYVADIFLPDGAARRIPQVCGTLAVLGLLVLAARFAAA